jgi:hypothetical protein
MAEQNCHEFSYEHIHHSPPLCPRRTFLRTVGARYALPFARRDDSRRNLRWPPRRQIQCVVLG